jgi:hypothetical protein
MKQTIDYEHLMDFVAEDISDNSLDDFFDIKTDNTPKIKTKNVDAEFPEEWQTLFVNIATFEDYKEFMEKLDGKPVPKLTKLIYEKPENKKNIFEFLE